MRLQKSTMCGLYAVLELAANTERQVSAGDIAEKYDISLNHLAKVLRTLVRARLIESVRGPGGGYRFSGNPKRITLLDIISLFEETGPGIDQTAPDNHEESRALHKVLRDIDDIAMTTLRSVSITSLLKVIDTERRKADRAPHGQPVRHPSAGRA